MKKVFFGLALACLTLSSCHTLNKSTAQSAPIAASVLQSPTVADMTVTQQKVSKTERWGFTPFHWGETPMYIRKSNMVAQLVEQNNGDVLIEPQWTFSKTSFGERVLTVTGFVGKYHDFHKATPEELDAIRTIGGGYKCNTNGEVQEQNCSLFRRMIDNIKK